LKNFYERKAWLVDDDVLLGGYVTKRKFYPNDGGCGFSYQKTHKKDIGKILFYDREVAIYKTGLKIVC